MPLPPGWTAASAIRAWPLIAWDTPLWRAHNRRYAATDAGGARRVTGRYHRAPDLYPVDPTWAALYCATTYGVCLGEIVRHLPRAGAGAWLANYRLTRLDVRLETVFDGRNLAAAGLTPDVLFDDDYAVSHALAAAALAAGAEGLLVPSATLLPDPILVVFPDALHPASRVSPLESIDPALNRPSP